MTLMETLDRLSVLNRDNGHIFTNTNRLEVIEECLWNSRYRKINPQGLFHLYSQLPVHKILESVVIVSSHVDCEEDITRCFTKVLEDGMLCGTYDNAITNAAITYLMLCGILPDNVLVAFTGDKEEDSHGASELIRYLRKKKILIKNVIVLDVTDMGWKDNADFTVENNFWYDSFGQKIIKLAENSKCNWRFVPSDPNNIPKYINSKHTIPLEAEEDESWKYDEFHIECFSFCLPVFGDMHSDKGVLARKDSLEKYTLTLEQILNLS